MREVTRFVFVYGTLQRGEERERCWPHAPVSVEPAEIRAALYDLGDYPAIVPDTDRIGGELWQLQDNDVAHTLRVLDDIECFGQGDVDLYVRRVVDCRSATEVVAAYTYYLADKAVALRHPRVLPGADGVCRWHRFR